MTPEQMRLRAVEALAEEFDRTHADPRSDADRWIGRLLRSGWRPVPAVVDKAGPRRPAPSAVAREHLAEARQVLEEKRGSRPELDGGDR